MRWISAVKWCARLNGRCRTFPTRACFAITARTSRHCPGPGGAWEPAGRCKSIRVLVHGVSTHPEPRDYRELCARSTPAPAARRAIQIPGAGLPRRGARTAKQLGGGLFHRTGSPPDGGALRFRNALSGWGGRSVLLALVLQEIALNKLPSGVMVRLLLRLMVPPVGPILPHSLRNFLALFGIHGFSAPAFGGFGQHRHRARSPLQFFKGGNHALQFFFLGV